MTQERKAEKMSGGYALVEQGLCLECGDMAAWNQAKLSGIGL
jgi:hypothetical protein